MRSRHASVALVAALVVPAAAFTPLVAASGSTTATAFGSGTPTFINSAAPQALDGNVDNAGEPSVGVDWTTGAGLYQADTSTYKLAFDNTANSVTWSDVSSPFSQFNLDPILATYSKSGTTAAGGDDGACGVMSLTHDDGASWQPTLPCPVAPDHPTVGIGAFTNPAPPDAIGTEAMYVCQQGFVDECSYSHDGGISWKPSVIDPTLTCVSLFGHVKIAPNGTTYTPDSNCSDPSGSQSLVGGFVSTDDGVTLQGYGIPNATTPSDGFDPSIAVAQDKNATGNFRVWESWSAEQKNGDYHPVISWSDDNAKTWAPIVDLSSTTSPAITAATFESAVAGDSGRAAVAYLGTTTPTNGKDPFASGFVGVWNLYVSYTYDGGATWQTVQVTTNPVQIGEIDAGGTTTSGQRNLLDFMDASLTKDGRVVVAYADGCINSCNAGSASSQSQDAWATVAYQTGGEGLFAAADTTPSIAPTPKPAHGKKAHGDKRPH